MSLFSHWSSKVRSQADLTLGHASPPARDLVERSARVTRLWRRLVAEVGPEAALEHLAVSYLTAMIDKANSLVSELMQQWRFGLSSKEMALQALAIVESDLAPRIDAAVGQVRLSSTRRESLDVAAAAHEFHTALWKAWKGYMFGSLSEPEMHAALEVKQAWTEVCIAWDSATGRAVLPLVG